MSALRLMASAPTSGMFAHQGGWDEILMVAAPLAFIGLLLWLANKRVDAKLEAQDAESE